jgi:hypothetical protein
MAWLKLPLDDILVRYPGHDVVVTSAEIHPASAGGFELRVTAEISKKMPPRRRSTVQYENQDMRDDP